MLTQNAVIMIGKNGNILHSFTFYTLRGKL